RVATLMLSVELCEGGGRHAMEQWFARALTADGDNRTACSIKLKWLHPKWHGTREELVAFGRACRDTGNWQSGIPLLVADAHLGVTDLLPDQAARESYLRQEEVWRDIESVYTEHLKHHPRDDRARSQFAYYSYLCARPAEAHRQFQVLGKNIRWGGRITEE